MANVLARVGSLLNGRHASTATIQTFVVKVLIVGLNLGTGVITARVLGSDGRGELAAIMLWPQFLAFTLTLGIPQSLVYNLKRYPDPDSRNELYSSALVLAGLMGVVATVVGIVFMPMWLSQYSAATIRAAQFFMLLAPFELIGLVFIAAFEARNEFTFANQLRYSLPIATLIIILGLLGLESRSPVAFGLAYAVPTIPINIWMFLRLCDRYSFRFANLRLTAQRLFDFGIKAYGVDLLSTLSGRIGQALVVGLLTATSMGLYTVALHISRKLNVFEDAINTVLLPKAAARPVPEIVAITGRAVRASTFLTTLCVIPLMIIGPLVITFLYGEEFRGAIPVFRILLIEVLLAGTTWMLSKAFMAAGKPGTVTLLQGFGLGITIPLTLLLVPRYGLVGAGLALLCSTALRFVFILACYPMVLKVKPPSLLLTMADIRYLKTSISQRNKSKG
jgi:antigen flippase